VIEVSGSTAGLLYQLTTRFRNSTSTSRRPMSRPSASAPATCFTSLDLLGAQVNAPTRQAAIKSALIHLLASEDDVAQPAA